MSLRVIGAGFGRTGTLSLKFALEKLGFDACYHMLEVVGKPDHAEVWSRAARGESNDWDAVFEGYQAAVDFPSSRFWPELSKFYPQAKIILSLRDSDSWYKSVMNTIYPASVKALEVTEPEKRMQTSMVYEVIWDGIFHGRIEDEAYAKSVFEARNQKVIDTVPEENLLVYRPGDGWQPLCTFLSLPVPDEDYPRVNSTKDFENRFPPRN